MTKILLLISWTVFLLCASCTPTKTVADTNCPKYKNSEFNRADILTNRMVVLPVTAREICEPYRQPMDQALNAALVDEFGNEAIVYANNSEINLNINSEILDPEVLQRIGHQSDAGYVLQLILLSYSNEFEENAGPGRGKDISELHLKACVWDTREGIMVWEGRGGYAICKNPDLDILGESAKGISKVIGHEPHEGPCESRFDIVDSLRKAHNGTRISIIVIIPMLFILPMLLTRKVV